MEMTGEYRIPAPRQKVWDALNDPEILKQAIPGCQSLEKSGDNAFDGKVKAKVGPVSATFNGTVTLSDLNPPESYKISGEGKGGAAGFAKGGATVKLSEEGEDTVLSYDVQAQVGGKLAQIGSRLVNSTAKKMADDFFRNFSQTVAGEPPKGETETEADAKASAEESASAPAAEDAQQSNEPSAEESQEMADKAMKGATQGQQLPGGAPMPADGEGSAGDAKKVSPFVWIIGVVAIVAVLIWAFAA